MKVEKLGYIDIPADVVLHAALGLKAQIICQRQERVDAMVTEIMARKKPSAFRLFFESNKANIQTADNREDALKIAKNISEHMFDAPYYYAANYRETEYHVCHVLISSSNTVIKQVGENGMMFLDLHTADKLTQYFP